MDFQKLSGPTFGSVCSGIESASVALHPQGWRAAWLAEIEAFPSATLAHHYPEVPNLGDMTTLPARVLRGEIEAPDALIGGTPCQAFSVAGMRAGLADPRGLLSIRFVELADAIDHVRARRADGECVVWWENVPGVLSDKENAFGCFLAALVGESEPLVPAGGRWTDAGCVYGPRRAAAWRVLDAQYFGLAQRRRRVFVVASARNGFDPAAVLFERESVRRDSAPRREPGKIAPTVPARSTGGGGLGTDFDLDGGLIASTGEISHCLNAGGMGRQDYETETLIAHTLRAEGFDASEDGTGRGTPLVPMAVAMRGREDGAQIEVGDDVAFTLRASQGGGDKPHVLAFSCKDHAADDLSPTLRAMGHGESHANAGGQVAVAFHHNAQASQLPGPDRDTTVSDSLTCSQQAAVATQMAVRRLTPRECERLQGFPDDYTRIPWRGKDAEACPDGPRYKALGNSMAVPVMAWIGRRISAELAP